MFVYVVFFPCLLTLPILMLIWRQNIIKSIYIRLWKMFLNIIFTCIKSLIGWRLNPALTVVCLFIYILFVCLFTYFISIISWSLKLEQITPPCWLCHAYFKVSNILYYVSWSYSIYVSKRSIVCSGIIIFLYLRET